MTETEKRITALLALVAEHYLPWSRISELIAEAKELVAGTSHWPPGRLDEDAAQKLTTELLDGIRL